MILKIVLIFLILPFSIFAKNKKETEYDLICEEVKKTFSIYPEEIVDGIYKIGEKKIEKAIPFILRLLDNENFVYLQYNGMGKWTKIDKEVEEALIKIGKNSLKYIYNLIGTNEYPYIEINEKIKEKLVKIASKITGENLKSIEEYIKFLNE